MLLAKIILVMNTSKHKILILKNKYFYLHKNSKKWTVYSVKILKCEFFLSALRRNSKKGPFYSVKFLKVGLF